MLNELHIRNFAIIDDLSLPFTAGFNVLTGETGAGKSIILDAVMLILGGRADRSMVRADTKAAYIEATFGLTPDAQVAVERLLSAEEIDSEGDEIVIIREVKANGGTVSRVNGSRVGTKLLAEIGEHLIDIHGQGSHLNLLRPKSHLPMLDSYAGLTVQCKALGKQVASLRALERELADLQRDERELAQRIDLLKFQVEEIDEAMLQAGEEKELRNERKRLGSAEQLMQHSAEAHHLLQGADEDSPSVIDMLSQTDRALTNLVRHDDSQNPLLERLQGLMFELSEVSGDIEMYQSTLEFNPTRLNEVEARLELISGLKRKYGDTIELVLVYRDTQAAELDKFEHSGERIEVLSAEIEKLLHEIGRLGQALSGKRQKSAEKLANMVERELRDLRMTAQFKVDFQTQPDDHGAYVGDERLHFDQSGYDKVEFLLSTNPGEPLKPMAKVASGGETARIMLALKTALAQVDSTPTLIFDEIDQGIGGRIGDTVGRKLWGLTAVGDHQVIVVTHLPQLAGYGDKHYHVRKGVTEGRTRTVVTDLDRSNRISELAAMIGTDVDSARGGAAGILDRAAEIKERVLAA